ncbi:MAG: DUF2878 domain-containing protein [Vicinamibacterales bacterium]
MAQPLAGPVVRFVGVQVGWFACVLGAAAGHPLLGPCVVALLLVAHAATPARGWRLAWLAATAALVGTVLDGILAIAGVLDFPPQAAAGWPAPIWMVALWVNLAPSLDDLAALLGPRAAVAAVVGAIGGPLAYLAGARLGAVALAPSIPIALAVVSVEWALAMPMLFRLRPQLKVML